MNDLTNIIGVLSKHIFAALADQLEKQNHKLTGALISSFEAKIRETAEGVIIDYFMNNYGVYLNDGVPPSRIPYTPPPPVRGGKSKYIQGLIRWARLKFGYSKRRATSVAFAVANKHKKQGFPLTAKGFINITLLAEADKIQEFVAAYTEALILENLKDFKFIK